MDSGLSSQAEGYLGQPDEELGLFIFFIGLSVSHKSTNKMHLLTEAAAASLHACILCMPGLACLTLSRGLGRGRQECPGWPGTSMHGFSEQQTILHSSCAVVLPARHESPCAALHGTSEFHSAWCQGQLVALFQTPCLRCYLSL